MAKTEYFYGVHSVESLLELEPERVLTLFTLKGRDDQRLKNVLALADPFGISVQQASRDKLEKLAGQPFHQGVVAAVRPHPTLNEQDLDDLLKQNPKISRKELCAELKINPSAVQKHIEKLKEANKIERIGGAKGGEWRVSE